MHVFTYLSCDRVNRALVDLTETKESVAMMYVKTQQIKEVLNF